MRSNTHTEALGCGRIMGDKWLGDEDDVIRLLLEAEEQMRDWETAVSEDQSKAVIQTRRTLGRLMGAIETAENNTLHGELDGVITAREAQRRLDLVAQWKTQRMNLNAKLVRGPPVKAVNHNFSRQEVVHLQNQGFRAQDELLDDLGTSIRRQQGLGESIGTQVDESSHLLDRIGQKTNAVDSNVNRENQRMDEMKTPPCSIAMWVIVFLLAAILIIILATDGGCRIVHSSAWCAKRPWGATPENATVFV